MARGAEEPNFAWVLPGHGGLHRLPAGEMRERMRGLARRSATYPEHEIDRGAVGF
ncbi:hypothetical protein ACFO4E_17405 [Nocardiopsis mangrovi]|uniref:MBL fold metallo-hydrolase n=1 Tax=Nocardiopsis mangrovi TaxID=1179818 RepID=A0ABV9DZW0_9ACTN